MGVIPHINGSICCWFRPSKYYWARRDRNESACWVSAIYSTEPVKCNRLEWTISESKVRYHTVYDIISCIRSILCHNNVMTLMLTCLCVCVIIINSPSQFISQQKNILKQYFTHFSTYLPASFSISSLSWLT